MPEGNMETIPFIIVLPDDNADNDKMGIFGSLRSDAKIGLKHIPIDLLKNNLANVSHSMISVLEDVKHIGQFRLKEITIQVEVSSDGGINLIGTASLGGKGAITLTFAE
ncbi:MAG: hypothetical protein M0Q13_10825 [Methanothrix sp.]|jgi:hypothetical protein|nr:hypothetical protein [Methanothrix sp.]